MLSIRKKFLFIHVPKTAGNSIQNILKEYSEDEIVAEASYQDAVERFEIRGVHPGLKKHSTLRKYKARLEPELFSSLFKFSTIRNPWDRLISLYFTPSSGRTEFSRKAFVKLVEKTQPLPHYIRTSKWQVLLSGFSSQPLDREINYLMRFENLDDDFSRVCDLLGIPKCKLPSYNASKRSHYSEYYDDELIDLVASKFKMEIRWGDYRFENKKILPGG